MKLDRKILIAYAKKYQGNYDKILKAIANKEMIEPEDDKRAITILDEEYPAAFLSLSDPPFVLFYKGDLNLLKKQCVGIVGSRRVSEYSLKATKTIAKALSLKYVIVSGMAKGIDRLAHLEAIHSGIIGILGSGIDYIYPYANKDLYELMGNKGLLISEYPDHTIPYAKHFPFRNRLIAALSDKIFVMKSDIKSGTMTTVDKALKLGKEVYVLPYRIDDDDSLGNNLLIYEGAEIIILANLDDY